ncbi:uroporphyrinogen-III C-methyltransferase [Photobacterium alginatilyticum]|uniref:Uroporphyrinogen-III C-methyltransferase n=1 Tax=Photobacterium alginatilyticum TaxID=1775171 RepID=A0ABW9YM40_9GAMM|nr:uroporphyrinogen-III C-methyltransferase [Photobacterium alginatilyticum]NBI54937.1 uroporphyrinogen-III C-methyltransferase [Photobacterium alginatilyticum]
MTDKKTNNETSADNKQSAVSKTTDKQGQSSAKAQAPETSAPKETAAKAEASQPAPAPQPAEKQSGSKMGAIAIALVIALGAGLYYHGHQQTQAQNAKMAALQQQLAGVKSNLTNSIAATKQETLSQVEKSLQRTDVSISQQGKSITGLQMALSEMKGRRPNDWLLAEADYLVKMAGRKLWLEHDTASATILLESADHRIAELNDPSMTPIREAMHSDITALKAVARVDRDGLVLRLTSLQEAVATLPLANAIVPEATATESGTVSTSVDDWKENLKTSLKNFSEHFVTYRTRDGSVIPLLSPKQDFYLQENIKSKLETAIKSVYREQGELYTKSLMMAKEWAEQFYDMEDPAAQSFISTLDKLAQENIEASYPSTLKSQPLITNAISERLRQQVKPLSTEENPA